MKIIPVHNILIKQNIFDDWKKLFNNIKNSKLRYRVSLDDCNRLYNVLRIKSVKSKTLLYVFV